MSLLAGVLADEGVVDLDEPLGDRAFAGVNPPLPPAYATMTLRHLLCMTAGIPFVSNAVEEVCDDFLDVCRSGMTLQGEPGTVGIRENGWQGRGVFGGESCVVL